MDEHDNGDGHGREFTIIVNGRPTNVTERELSFTQVVNLAYDNNPPTGPNILFTVTYSKGEDHKPKGSLLEGESVRVKDGMIFHVTATDRS